MDRFWFLTFTTYGTWMPGDRRGSVTTVRRQPGPRARQNTPGTPSTPPMPSLARSAALARSGPPVYLMRNQAQVLLRQFRETAAYRDWHLFAVAIMRNHVHIVVGVDGDPDPASLLRDFKSYGSRALNAVVRDRPVRWWTEGGSRRRLHDEPAVIVTMRYVRDQQWPLATWIDATIVSADENAPGLDERPASAG